MEKDKSILLQKQVMNNAQDLQNEFLDLKSWEEKMKIADEELKSSTTDSDQVLPPVRKKKISTRTKSKTKENGCKVKRIKSSDYSSWDRFDADKACEEVDKENESEDSGEEILSEKELEEKYAEATTHKVMGNKYVTQQKWDKAMACYNEAIKIFPFDAIFYANRALCHLKMDNLYSAEADCTSAIQRDENYVKAYHRRATARIMLKQYKEAIDDLEKLLSLEPSNKEAQKMLSNAKKYLENPKSSISTINQMKKPENELKIKEKSENQDNNPKKPAESNSKFRKWLPKSVIGEDMEIVEPIVKLPHQQLKYPLKNIPVTLADLDSTKKAKIAESLSVPNDNVKDKVVKLAEKINVDQSKEENKTMNDVPVPRTAIQFLLIWRRYKSIEFRYKYLKQIAPEKIPDVFKDSMESDIFGEILSTLKLQFISHNDEVFSYLKCLSQIKRFRMLTMFLSEEQKEDLKTLFDYCKNSENISDTIINEIRSKYEL